MLHLLKNCRVFTVDNIYAKEEQMDCPVCNQPMEVYKTLITHSKEGKQFDHRRFVCKKDDVWARLEIPREVSPQAQQLQQQSSQT
jgi:hypothetical protein